MGDYDNPTDPNATPTGGAFNDPNTWQTDPSYGQIGANKGAGYNPAYWADKGGWDAYHQGRQAYRAQFQPGGANYERQQGVYRQILHNHPNNAGDLGSLLNANGYQDVQDQGRAFYRQVMGNFTGNNITEGNLAYNPASGMWKDVGTSDVNAQPFAGAAPGDFYSRIRGDWGPRSAGSRYEAYGMLPPAYAQRPIGGYYAHPAPVPHPTSPSTTAAPNTLAPPDSTSNGMPVNVTASNAAPPVVSASSVQPVSPAGYAPPQAYGSLGDLTQPDAKRIINPAYTPIADPYAKRIINPAVTPDPYDASRVNKPRTRDLAAPIDSMKVNKPRVRDLKVNKPRVRD